MSQATPQAQLIAARWGGILTLLGFLAVFYGTLFPLNFRVPPGMTIAQAAAPFDLHPYEPGMGGLLDMLENVVLFLPLGFAVASLLRGRGIKAKWVVPLVVLICGLTSFCIEFLQQWLPTRVSAVSDIVSNTTGGLLGSVFFLIAGIPLLQLADFLLGRLRRLLILPVLALIFAAWCVFVLRPVWHLYELRQVFQTWDASFALAVGNSPDMHRLWHGSIDRLEIASKALPENLAAVAYAASDLRAQLGDSVLASYRPGGDGAVPDLSGHSPPLTQGRPDPGGADRWLVSTGPMTDLNNAVVNSSQFTIRVTGRSSGQWQLGPARLVTLAGDVQGSNFTVGQDGYDLVLRLRTVVAGGVGVKPAMYIPNFFYGGGPFDVIIAYDNPNLRIYLNGPDRCERTQVPVDFGGLAKLLERPMILPFHGWLPEMFRGAFYLFAFGPFGVLLGFLVVDPRVRPGVRQIAVGAGLLLPTLAMQFISVDLCRRWFRADNLLMGIAMPALVMILWAGWLARHADSYPLRSMWTSINPAADNARVAS